MSNQINIPPGTKIVDQPRPKVEEKPKIDKAVIDAIKQAKELTISTNQIVTK